MPCIPKPGRSNRRFDTSGFTVLEVLLAVVILGLAGAALLESLSLSGRNLSRLGSTRREIRKEASGFARLLSDPELEATGEIVLEGGRYRLRRVESASGRFTSLRLEKKEGP